MNDFTLMMIKPGFERVIPQILTMIRRAGLESQYWKRILLTDSMVRTLYYQDSGKPWMGRVVEYLCSAPVVVFIIEGSNAIGAMAELKYSIRQKVGIDEMRNVIHVPETHFKLQQNLRFFRDVV